ncbi:MAG: conjugative transposon protein TraJ [Bacteroidia bacterium]|nr:conjugative transposon protein TraJ [Bacteroidia bacterium]
MDEFQSLHELLQNLYSEMLPLASTLIGPARAIGGTGAFLYISYRVWGHMARAEPIDFVPFIRPLILGMVIAGYPSFLALMEGTLKPVVTATESVVKGQNEAVVALSKRKEAELAQRQENQLFENSDAFNAKLAEMGVMDVGSKVGLYMDKAAYDVKKNFRLWIKSILELFFHAAALAINTVRTFFLIVLSIVGPISIGLSLFDGFQDSLTRWMSQFINVYLWLPVANIFGAICARIQVLMLETDLARIQEGSDEFITADYGYMLFLLLSIAGYFTIPSVAGWVVSASGMGAALGKVTQMGAAAVSGGVGAGAMAAGAATRGFSRNMNPGGGFGSSSGAEGAPGGGAQGARNLNF